VEEVIYNTGGLAPSTSSAHAATGGAPTYENEVSSSPPPPPGADDVASMYAVPAKLKAKKVGGWDFGNVSSFCSREM
jgi:hypothetical protein